jgi:hypothetical protein
LRNCRESRPEIQKKGKALSCAKKRLHTRRSVNGFSSFRELVPDRIKEITDETELCFWIAHRYAGMVKIIRERYFDKVRSEGFARGTGTLVN